MKWYVIAYVDYKSGEYVMPTWDSLDQISEIYRTRGRALKTISNGVLFGRVDKRLGLGGKHLEVVEIEVSIPKPKIKEVEVTMDDVCEKFGRKVIIKKDEADCPSCAD